MNTVIKAVSRTLLVVGFAVAAGSLAPQEAKADFQVELHMNRGPDWAWSRHNTRVYYQRNGSDEWEQVGPTRRLNDKSVGIAKFTHRGADDHNDVRRIKVEMGGKDLMWVDAVRLMSLRSVNTSQGWPQKTWGALGNQVGYCFSKYSGRGNNASCWRSTAYQYITFTN